MRGRSVTLLPSTAHLFQNANAARPHPTCDMTTSTSTTRTQTTHWVIAKNQPGNQIY